MQVRDATVGPLSGTTLVSGSATSTCSYGMPSASATICACMVRVPWPISVLEVSTRTPVAVSSTVAREASLSSPLPVNPEPCQYSASPIPRPAARVRLSLPPEARAPHRGAQDLERAAVLAQTLAGGGGVAGRSRLRSRSRTGSRPSASAMRSMWTSTANWVCGAPKPRNAPLGGVLVNIARAAIRTLSQR